MKSVYLSLGSNMGDRLANIQRALATLPSEGVHVLRTSSFYRTEPVDFRAQPWFVNCAVEAETELMPLQLLGRCQAVERKLGRQPGIPKGPRPIDIDILLYENVVIRSSALRIPHAQMAERKFVLIPLRELAPTLRHPVTRRTVVEMLHDTPDTSQVMRLRLDS